MSQRSSVSRGRWVCGACGMGPPGYGDFEKSSAEKGKRRTWGPGSRGDYEANWRSHRSLCLLPSQKGPQLGGLGGIKSFWSRILPWSQAHSQTRPYADRRQTPAAEAVVGRTAEKADAWAPGHRICLRLSWTKNSPCLHLTLMIWSSPGGGARARDRLHGPGAQRLLPAEAGREHAGHRCNHTRHCERDLQLWKKCFYFIFKFFWSWIDIKMT